MSGSKPLVVQTPRDATHYAMDHKKRGMALIFNHQYYKNQYAIERKGTNVDCENICNSLKKLGFDVENNIYQDLREADIKAKLKKVSEMDHSDSDCLVVVMLTHGKLGKLFAYDEVYNLDNIFSHFTGDKCESLAGKPKIFFIQACQGDKLNYPITVKERTVTDGQGSREPYRIPMNADFLIAQSTIPGYYAWRGVTGGSWFIRSLCLELEENGTQLDLLTLLTHVARRVATEFESYIPEKPHMNKMKQIPCTTSMLMRLIRFTPPRIEEENKIEN